MVATATQDPLPDHSQRVLSRGGVKDADGAIYFEYDADAGLVAAGFHSEPIALAAIRGAIARDPAGWADIMAPLERAGGRLSHGASLARMPRGFEAFADTPVADALKLRNHIVSRPLTASEITDPQLVARIADFAEAARPFLELGWRALRGAV